MFLLKLKPFYIFLFFSLLSCGAVSAQTNSENRQQAATTQVQVKGRLTDSTSKEQIAFASVLLKNQETHQEFSLNTDSSGYFDFFSIPMGSYVLKAYYVGYPQISKSVNVKTATGAALDIGNIYMKHSKNVIKEVSVLGYKDLVEQRPDGIEYLAEKDPTNKGTSAAEVLQKVPMLTVDLDDNLQLRGNGNVKVLIDGRPSTMIASSVSDVLKQIPSDNIKSVQVITSPGAKYDAEGSAGVVNIITKKSFVKGISGRVFTGINYNLVDQNTRGHGGVDLNYRHNKLGLSAALGGGHWSHTSESYATRTTNPGLVNQSILQQQTETDGGGNFFWGRLSGDYSFDSLNSISAGVRLNPGNWKNDQNQLTQYPIQDLNYNQVTHSSSPRTNYSFNGTYNRKFRGQPGRTLDFMALYSLNEENSKYNLNQNAVPENLPSYQEESANQTKNKEFTFQADYTHPLKDHHQKIETGLKYINRNVYSDYDLYSKDDTTGGDWLLNPNRTNSLQYSQQVAAAYGQFTTDLTNKLSFIGGLRYEFTNIDGSLKENGGTFQSNFNNLLPSAIFSYKLRQLDRINLSYTQRIERPSIDFINPYVNSSDPFNITKGNPSLSPEQIHKVELNYNTMMAGASVNVAAFYSLTKNGIEAFTNLDNNGVAVTTYGNYAKNNTFGFNLFGSTTFFNRWRINLNGNLYYKSLSGSTLNVDNTGWQYDAHFSSDVKIYRGLSASAFGMYRGRDVMLQGMRSGWYRYSLGLKQEILKGKGDVTLAATNFFSPNIKTVSDFNYGDAIYNTVSYRRARGIRIGFSYNFGKMKFNDQRNKEINNNDLKSGGKQDSGNQQMGG